MQSTDRRFPAVNATQRLGGSVQGVPAGSEWQYREAVLDEEIQRCRGIIQANKAERLYQSSFEGRRGF
ncbi:hypothetical protein GN316_00210 [Xylophilus sp. Kf1]|nr:hypothetical protein [Xylophilus sp. Kf1]